MTPPYGIGYHIEKTKRKCNKCGVGEGQRALPKRLSQRIGGIEAEYRIFGTITANPKLPGRGRAHWPSPTATFSRVHFTDNVIKLTCHCEPVRTLAWQSPSIYGIATSAPPPRNDMLFLILMTLILRGTVYLFTFHSSLFT